MTKYAIMWCMSEKITVIGITAVVIAYFAWLGFGTTDTPELTSTGEPIESTWETDTLTDEPSDYYYVDDEGSYDCTDDCSGHQAGYGWASEHEICDTEYDNSYSESFNEGVRAWARNYC